MALLRAIVGIFVTVAIAGFVALNSQAVDIVYSPFSDKISIPVYVIAIGFALFGFVAGSIVTWLNSSGVRKDRRAQKKKIKSLEKDIERLTNDGKFSKPGNDNSDVDDSVSLPVINAS